MKDMKNLCKHGLFMPLLALMLCMGLASTPAFAADVGEPEIPTTEIVDIQDPTGSDESYVNDDTGDDDKQSPEGGDNEASDEDGTTNEIGTENGEQPGEEGTPNEGDENLEPEKVCTCGAEGDTHTEGCDLYVAPEEDPTGTEGDEVSEPAVCTCTTKCGNTVNDDCTVCKDGGECKATSSGVQWDEATG
ncbi:MAG: hypothetical protein K2M15_08075, partial [Oscillospiraceae bacterium]|nr:hypothetical protein [Oscillospiraceae bacterium]